MSDYSSKLISGVAPNSDDWHKFLLEAHRKAPGMTPKTFSNYKTSSGQNTYDILSDAYHSSTAKNILDLACGDGHFTNILSSKFNSARITGVDISPDELSVAREKHGSPNVSFELQDATQLSFKENAFDAVFCHLAVMLINPVEKLLSEVHRVLVPGGTFASVVASDAKRSGIAAQFGPLILKFLGNKYPGHSAPTAGDPRTRTETDLDQLLLDSKFRNISIKDYFINVDSDPEAAWQFFSHMYLVMMLSGDDQDEFRLIFHEAASAAAKQSATFSFPLRKIICIK